MQGVAEWCAFYRENIHRFVEDYLHIKLKLFQKIANASRCEGIVLPHMRDDSGKKRLPDRFPEQSIKKERLTEYDRFLDDYK